MGLGPRARTRGQRSARGPSSFNRWPTFRERSDEARRLKRAGGGRRGLGRGRGRAWRHREGGGKNRASGSSEEFVCRIGNQTINLGQSPPRCQELDSGEGRKEQGWVGGRREKDGRRNGSRKDKDKERDKMSNETSRRRRM